MVVLAACIFAMPTVAASVDASFPDRKTHATMVMDVIDTFVVPRVDAFAKQTGTLAAAVKSRRTL